MDICRNVGVAAALAIGIGAALAASMGSIGYALGAVAAAAITLASRTIDARRP